MDIFWVIFAVIFVLATAFFLYYVGKDKNLIQTVHDLNWDESKEFIHIVGSKFVIPEDDPGFYFIYHFLYNIAENKFSLLEKVEVKSSDVNPYLHERKIQTSYQQKKLLPKLMDEKSQDLEFIYADTRPEKKPISLKKKVLIHSYEVGDDSYETTMTYSLQDKKMTIKFKGRTRREDVQLFDPSSAKFYFTFSIYNGILEIKYLGILQLGESKIDKVKILVKK
jgi:hypothetical protein